jgi:plasmid stabilization system protein ParE
MSFELIFKPLAREEIAEAYRWYQQPQINMAAAFLLELERISRFITQNPLLYQRVEGDIRRANFNRFPYSLFYVIDGQTINVLSCFHQHRRPRRSTR